MIGQSNILSELVVAVPAAAAVVITVMLFLRHLKDERKSRDETQKHFLDSMSQLSAPIQELTMEVRALRKEHEKSA